jgi:hypothetical protein
MCGLGLKNLYKWIFYKSRMEQKLERDKLTRRFIREVNSQIWLLPSNFMILK